MEVNGFPKAYLMNFGWDLIIVSMHTKTFKFGTHKEKDEILLFLSVSFFFLVLQIVKEKEHVTQLIPVTTMHESRVFFNKM